eukprot:CAMPEP_0182429268 /NCGR_PEP_ID=MMETSP1167-20130531/25642_1 /TAXON_ID=2988 /ORGANISM="Mallomonas Sp, Strain CCMP3275" /LENGTH=158 /DNA_ID=CAMNT_0024612685 /DNA_START=198 /DNA_END=674 /DNA_ORIENTATION=+
MDSGIFRLPDGKLDENLGAEPYLGISDESNGLLRSQNNDEEIKPRVLRQMEYAFDNYQIFEIHDMHRRLWLAGEKSSEAQYVCSQLMQLTIQAEEIEAEAERRQKNGSSNNNSYGMEDLADAMRVIRSSIRMYGKDAEFCSDDGVYNPTPDFKWPWQK